MTAYQQAPAQYHQQLPQGPGPRPATLTAAVGAAIGAAVLNIVSAVVMLASLTDMVRNQIAEHNSGGVTVDPSRVDLTSERAEGLRPMFQGMAFNTIFWAIVLALLAFFALRGGRATRILATLVLVVTALVKTADLVTSVPTVSLVIDVFVAVLALAAIVLFFLPASNAYGKRRRAARQNTAH